MLTKYYHWTRSLFIKDKPTTRRHKPHIHLSKQQVQNIEQVLTVYPNTDLAKLAKSNNVSYSTLHRIVHCKHKHSTKLT